MASLIRLAKVKGKAALLLFLTAGFLVFNIEIPKRAFRFYERGDLEKTVEALDKSLGKDSLNPAANYLYSRLYIDTAFWNYSVDTSYWYVNEAIADFGRVTEAKDLSSLKDVGVDSLSLEALKDEVDSLQFLLIKAKHTIADYNWFMTTHNDAIQIPEAIKLRDHIAYEDAQQIHTWQAYQTFMQAYPESVDYPLADSLYKKLIFEERTADGSYRSNVDFLEEFPGTPYRELAEQKIFEIGTSFNSLEAYTDFLKNYPNSELAKKILPRLYPIYKEKYGSEGFFDFFQLPSIKDSLESAINLEGGYWLPKLDNGSWGFFDARGKEVFNEPLSAVDKAYLCEPLTTDFVVGVRDGVPRIMGRNGALIYEGPFITAKDEGYGYISLEDTRGVRLIHKTGEMIIEEPQASIAVLNEHFIRTEQNEKFGLTTINGRDVLPTEYDDIDTLLHYIWLEKEGAIGLITSEALFPAIYGEAVNPSLLYEEIELLDNGMLWAIRNNQEGVLNTDLEVVVPFADHAIYDREYGWLLKREEQTQLLHKDYPFLADSVFEKHIENSQWIALKKDSAWQLLDRLGQLPIAEGYDSLSFLGENMVMLYQGDSVLAQFRTGKQLLMTKAWSPSLLVPQNYVKTGETALFDFFMLSSAKNYRKVYNHKGREILSATYKEVTAMGPDLLRLQKRNTALVDSTGAFVLKFIYDGIGSYDQGYVSIIKGGKVGIVNIEKGLTIAPSYESLITPYADTVLMAKEDGLIGFINSKNQALSGFDFDEVNYWNDTIALARIEEEWLLHNIATEEAVYEGIQAFEYLRNDAEEKRLLITTESGKGVYSSSLGELVEPTYDDIKVLGTADQPVYFAVKIVAEANLYVVIYFDADGNKLFTLTYQQEEYFGIACTNN